MADDNKYSLLSKIEYPDDLRKLKIDELPQVCEELRSDIIDEVSMNPGHFASSLEACPHAKVSYWLSKGEGKGRMPCSLRFVQNDSLRPVRILWP